MEQWRQRFRFWRRGSTLEWCCTSCCPVLHDELPPHRICQNKKVVQWSDEDKECVGSFWGQQVDHITSSEVILDDYTMMSEYMMIKTILRIEWFLLHPSVITLVKCLHFSNQDITGEDEWSRQLKWSETSNPAGCEICLFGDLCSNSLSPQGVESITLQQLHVTCLPNVASHHPKVKRRGTVQRQKKRRKIRGAFQSKPDVQDEQTQLSDGAHRWDSQHGCLA